MTSKRRSSIETKTHSKKKRMVTENSSETCEEQREDGLYKHLIAFLRTRQQHSDNMYLNFVNEYLNKDQDEASEKMDKNVHGNIEYLTNFLIQTNCSTRGIQRTHVATLLFPWAIQTLMYQYRERKDTFPMHLLWNAFARSYKSLQIDENASEEILQHLPQGTLNKLVPFALEVAFQEDGDDRVVTSCLLWMIRLSIYRPTIDHICSVIIPLMNRMLVMQESHSNDIHLMVSPNQYNIIRNIMELILSRLESRCSNPKKTFQSMASEASLVFLARMYSVRSNDLSREESMDDILGTIICITFFDGQHHMDGFRSMNLSVPNLKERIQLVKDCQMPLDTPKKRKGAVTGHEQSYQKLLLHTFESILSSNDESKVDTIKWVGLFVPMVLESFMKESSRMDETTTRKSRVDMTAKMQLRFWAHMMQPFFRIMDTYDEKQVFPNHDLILNPMQESLEILLRYDCYLPSYSDPGNEHQKYLEAIGETILKFSEKYAFDANSETILKQFEALFALNHNIFHDNLTRLMVRAMRMTSCTKQQVELFACICKVYEKLRQINYFLDSIIESRFQISDDTIDFVHEAQFVDTFSLGIQSLPHGQLKTVLNIMNEHILKALDKDQCYLDFVVDIYVLVLKAIHVTEANAANVNEICGNTENSIIPKLLSIDKNGILDIQSDVTNSGLYLLGWIITVSTRCIFWLNDATIPEVDNASHFDIFPTIQYISTSTSNRKISSLGALQHLACYKLIQLHSLVYMREQAEGIAKMNYKVEDGPTSRQLIGDASELANFIITAAASRRHISHRETNWRIVCEHLGIISTYANNEQMGSFLRWFMVTYASNESNESTQDERDAIESLLVDSSFFETFHKADIATDVAFSVIQNHMQRSDIVADFLSWNDCCTKIDFIFQRNCDGIDEVHVHFISRTLRLLKALLPDSTGPSSRNTRLYGCFLVFADTVRLLRDKPEVSDVIDLIDTSISILIKDLDNMSNTQNECAPIAENIISHIFLMIKKMHTLSEKSTLVVSGSQLAAKVLRLGWNQEDEINLTRLWSSLIGDVQESSIDISSVSASLIISRQCILMASKSIQYVNTEKRVIVKVGHMFHSMKDLFEFCAEIEVMDIVGKLILPFFADAMLLAKLLDERNFGGYDKVCFQKLLSEFIQKSISIMKGSFGTVDDSTENGCLYFLASILDHDMVPLLEQSTIAVIIQDTVISQLRKRDGFIHPLLDSSYAFICKKSNSDTLRELCEDLLNKLHVNALQFDQTNLLAVLYCFHIMILSTKSTEMKIVVGFIKPLIVPALHLVGTKSSCNYNSTWSMQVRRMFGLLQSILSISGEFVLRGNDYAAIFTTINTIFIADSVCVDEKLFVSACHLVTTMLKVDRKLVYGCVPSLTNTLRLILNHMIKLPSRVNGADSASGSKDSMHAISTLFQLLPEHKDVFKKHMMHLVLFFAERAQFSLDAWKKMQLELLLFNLLDLLSDFEIKQLGTLMQPSAKASFQSFFKRYNKNKYTGAY